MKDKPYTLELRQDYGESLENHLSYLEGLLAMLQVDSVINRSRRRAPNLSAFDRLLFGFWSLFLTPRTVSSEQPSSFGHPRC